MELHSFKKSVTGACSKIKYIRHFRTLYEDVIETFSKNCNIQEDEIDRSVKKIAQAYYDRPWDQPKFHCINFGKMVTCLAYLRRYATCHSDVVYSEMEKYFNAENEYLTDILEMHSLNVVSIGGGPGNDIIGFCSSFADQDHELEDLKLSVIDLSNGWCPIFHEVINTVKKGCFGSVSEMFKNIHVSSHFITSDLLSAPENIEEAVNSIREADVLLMVKMLSHIPEEKHMQVLQTVFNALKPGSLFLLIDFIDDEIVSSAALESKMDILEQSLHCEHTITSANPCLSPGINTSHYHFYILKKSNE